MNMWRQLSSPYNKTAEYESINVAPCLDSFTAKRVGRTVQFSACNFSKTVAAFAQMKHWGFSRKRGNVSRSVASRGFYGDVYVSLLKGMQSRRLLLLTMRWFQKPIVTWLEHFFNVRLKYYNEAIRDFSAQLFISRNVITKGRDKEIFSSTVMEFEIFLGNY